LQQADWHQVTAMYKDSKLLFLGHLYNNDTSSSSGVQSASALADDFFPFFLDCFGAFFDPGTGSGFMQSGIGTLNPTHNQLIYFIKY